MKCALKRRLISRDQFDEPALFLIYFGRTASALLIFLLSFNGFAGD